jgi:hypothetical protein
MLEQRMAMQLAVKECWAALKSPIQNVPGIDTAAARAFVSVQGVHSHSIP